MHAPWPGPERTAHQLAAAACSCTWCAPGPVMRGVDALALLASLQHADGKSAGQCRARIEQLARANAVSRGHNIDLVDVRMLPGSTSPCRRCDGARAGRMHGPGQDRSTRRTSWRPPPAAAPGSRARPGSALR